TTGKTMTELKGETKGLSDHYDIKIYGLIKPREEIYSSINSRIEKMFRRGLIPEVKSLKRKRLSRTAKGVLGYREISGYLSGEYDADTAKELLKRNTRRFAKRQLTWFRADKRIKWFDLSKLGEKEILKNITREND
ncbi:MAG: tRNA (adenosine(37)-N6)-dimethylallyltransferase MiaA, partial [Candidatus Omnitrophota bacterium]|nr:tRNA (adenosine(37)-N6)-dimethylallyltransferase MiaA [Candidatus Omnitrophota bacterium]